jgi:hypothetical protein
LIKWSKILVKKMYQMIWLIISKTYLVNMINCEATCFGLRQASVNGVTNDCICNCNFFRCPATGDHSTRDWTNPCTKEIWWLTSTLVLASSAVQRYQASRAWPNAQNVGDGTCCAPLMQNQKVRSTTFIHLLPGIPGTKTQTVVVRTHRVVDVVTHKEPALVGSLNDNGVQNDGNGKNRTR